MQVGVIGLNHKIADLRLRESLASACQRTITPGFSKEGDLSCILLITCNRIEVYFSAPDLASAHTAILGILRREIQEIFDHKVYSFFGNDCFFHLVLVTAGLDSAIIGETEIQGQVKQAYEAAAALSSLTPELHFLFQKSLKIGKDVRSNYPVERGMPNVEDTIYDYGMKCFGDFKNIAILFVGTSQINTRIFSYFAHKGVTDVTFCNRTEEKAVGMRQKVLPWEDLNLWTDYDFVLFGTKSPIPLIEMHESISPKTRVMIDLGVPRNVKMRRIPGIIFMNMDQLNRLIEKRRKFKSSIVDLVVQEAGISVMRQTAIFATKQKSLLIA